MNVTNVLVNSSAINKPKEETIRGVDVTTMLSPFDVPQSVSCEFDEDTCTLTFKFKYISDDKKHYTVSSNDGLVKLVLGKASDRVYEIEVDQACMQESQPRISIIERTRNRLEKHLNLHPNNKSGSFEAVGNVLKKYGRELIPSACAS